MFFRSLNILFLVISSFVIGHSQKIKTLVLCDAQTKLPIEGMHVFAVNSTYGLFSDEAGQINVDFDKCNDKSLYFSHLSFEPKELSPQSYKGLNRLDTIYFEKRFVSLSTIDVTAKRAKGWKKKFGKFRKYFLGQDKNSKKVRIQNPEVLVFTEKNQTFKASASSPLHIRNEYLGYQITFYLDSLMIEPNGSSQYSGRAAFSTIEKDLDQKKVLKQREKSHRSSLQHFLRYVMQEENFKDYAVDFVRYNQESGFEKIQSIKRTHEIIQYDDSLKLYKLSFPEFLQIKNKKVKVQAHLSSGNIRSSSYESQRRPFNGSSNNANYGAATSQLYKIAPHLYIDAYGTVKNSEVLKEYGYFANQRMTYTLPWDYKEKINFTHSPKAISSIELAQLLLFEKKSVSLKAINDLNPMELAPLVPILLDFLRLSGDQNILASLQSKLKAYSLGEITNYYNGLEYIWKKEPIHDLTYPEAKALLHKEIDPKFEMYFKDRGNSNLIRWDEIVWGGVVQDGIPPLRNPKMISVGEADYLKDDHIIFGIVIDGIARAYPKRILAWHEMFVQKFGDKEIAGVYCTLCGTVIPYDQQDALGDTHQLGTSGFLYRSNKLMFDKKTQSLWNTTTGQPVVGPLVTKQISLKAYPVITTNWGEWKKQYPNSEVLSLDTGHQRDYDEGVAYKKYFESDQLMFPVPSNDSSLALKDEVLVIRHKNYNHSPIAVSTSKLRKNPLLPLSHDGKEFFIITERSGASRVYTGAKIKFDKKISSRLLDQYGKEYTYDDEAIWSDRKALLQRVVAHRSFWFSWYNQFPNTSLVK